MNRSQINMPATARSAMAWRVVAMIVALVIAPAVLLWLTNLVIDTVLTDARFDSVFALVGLGRYNTRVVVLGTTMLGAASSVIGSFALLRKRALMGDVLSHAMLPGIAIAFFVMTVSGGDGKWLPGLLIGAVLFGLLGLGAVTLIRATTRLKEDAALGIVLSVFFGLGITAMSIVTRMEEGNQAGLESFIYGNTAAMLLSDARLIATVGVLACWYCLWLFKEFGLICFDQQFAGSQGWPVTFLDMAMMVLVIAVTVIGLQAVGLILTIAMLIIPAAAARFWSDYLPRMVILSAIIGGVSGMLGSALSATVSDLPAGAVIVVVASSVFVFSMLFGTARGVILRTIQQWRLRHRIRRQHLLRAVYEWREAHDSAMPTANLLHARAWNASQLQRAIDSAKRADLVRTEENDACQLTAYGMHEASRIVRNHRLWEMFLITHADIAPSHVDRDADMIEHVLGSQMVERLEQLLAERQAMPRSPHEIE